MLDDASGAVEEAGKLVEAFELEVGKEESSAKGFFWKGWGGGNGVDGLWAEVWCAVSHETGSLRDDGVSTNLVLARRPRLSP